MIIFFFGTGFLWLLGGGLLLLVLIGGVAAQWLVEYALGVGIVLFVFWLAHGISVTASLLRDRPCGLALTAAAAYCLPQVPVWLAGYEYLLREIEKVGTSSAVLDLAVCLGIYTGAGIIWERVVVRDRVGPVGTVALTLAHLCASAFFLRAFYTYR